jgi:hypothetical protein
MRLVGALLVSLTGLILTAGCGEEKLPSRDEIPILRARVYALEQGILHQDRAAIDSLLSVEVLKSGHDSDSLLRFVYGSDGAFPFYRLGDYNIIYGNDVAVVKCYIMDSTEGHDRPFKLQFRREAETPWLVRSFEADEPDPTSADQP